jgi:nitroimidazol reductase NimA-like FMN-containing flavoprotein (pyridoxamine 5'-phosphate oxidase superfamily)
VWFLYENDILYLAIQSSSAKGRNLARSRKIAVMIDVRESYEEAGVTAIGEAELIAGDEAKLIVRRVHEKYLPPDAFADTQVGPVFAAIDDVAVKLRPTKWLSWDISEVDQHAFGGAISRNRYLKAIDP